MIQTIDLLAVDYDTDSSGGQTITIHNRRTVFCRYKSIRMQEVYQAMAVNRSPEIVAILADYLDYNDEQFAVVSGNKVYRVLRTYITGNSIELTLERTRDLDEVI